MNFIASFSAKNRYFQLILVHILLGIVIYHFPAFSKVYALLMTILGFYFIIKNKNKNHEVLYAAAYIVGAEVLLRMTEGNLSYEFAKYSIILFSLFGMFYSGTSRKAVLFLIFLLLLVPSILINNDILHLTKKVTNAISFDLSGPVSLAIFAIYALEKKVSFDTFRNILFTVGLPIISCAVYIFVFSPEIKGNITSVESNAYFSGMFGPNQVASILGLGMFAFFIQWIVQPESKIHFVVNLMIVSFLSYIGVLTFSRGGIITGLCCIIVFSGFVYWYAKTYGKSKSKSRLLYFFVAFLAMFALISYQTDGLIEKRYTNRDHLGRVKRDKITDRKELAKQEVKLFIKNPVLGIGVTEGDKVREKELGYKMVSHDELSRMLAEHGSFGLVGILILLLVPLWIFYKYRQNPFFAAFYLFWFLTINHNGMRLAAPSFIYALALLTVDYKKESFFRLLKDD